MAEHKLSIIFVRNPFDPHGSRDTATIEYRNGASLADYMLDLAPAEEYALSLNGGKVALELRPTTFPEPGDQLVVCPVIEGGGDSKNILRIIAIIVVTIIATLVGQFYVGPLLFGAGGLGLTGTTLAMACAATGALMGLGASMLMNALLPPPKVSLPTLGDGGSDSPTYGWQGVRTMAMQGVAIPVVFGTHRVGGNIISQRILSDGTNQYLDMLIALCEGPIESATNILVNNNPSGNFTNVSIETRLGTMDQTVIPFFGDISTESFLNYHLQNSGWSIQNTWGDGVEGLEVDVTFPGGLWYQHQTTYQGFAVSIAVQYKPAGASDSEYVDFDGADPTNHTFYISAQTREPYTWTTRIDGVAPGQYTVRVMRSEDLDTANIASGGQGMSQCYWTALREFVYDDMAYPGMALVGMRALATNQLSGSQPNVTTLVTRGNIWVYDGTQWVAKRSDNPAWASYDMLVNTQYGGRIPVSRVDYPSFQRWADYCDTIVPTQNGSEKRMTFNAVLDTSTSLWDAVNMACQVGRGAIIIRGTKYFAYYDGPGTPTQLFSVANIVPDSFKEMYLPVKDRATELEVQYADIENEYERSSLNVMTDEGFAGTGLQQKTTISMIGCVYTTQAYREARYRLLMNQYLIRTLTFDVGVDSLACEVGDLVYIQHDIPSWGEGGRVISATINTVTLDHDITLTEGLSYRIMVRHANDMLSERTVVVPVGGYTGATVTVTTDFPQEPSQYDCYVFGEVDKDRKIFRIVSIRRSKEFDFTLTALEYNPLVYADQIAPEPPVVTSANEVPPHVLNSWAVMRWIAEVVPDPVIPTDPYTTGGGDGNNGEGSQGNSSNAGSSGTAGADGSCSADHDSCTG